jgi:hypothetical protein
VSRGLFVPPFDPLTDPVAASGTSAPTIVCSIHAPRPDADVLRSLERAISAARRRRRVRLTLAAAVSGGFLLAVVLLLTG